jgi:hypothetical protein
MLGTNGQGRAAAGAAHEPLNFGTCFQYGIAEGAPPIQPARTVNEHPISGGYARGEWRPLRVQVSNASWVPHRSWRVIVPQGARLVLGQPWPPVEMDNDCLIEAGRPLTVDQGLCH